MTLIPLSTWSAAPPAREISLLAKHFGVGRAPAEDHLADTGAARWRLKRFLYEPECVSPQRTLVFPTMHKLAPNVP